MTATPTTFSELNTAVATRVKPCLPSPNPDPGSPTFHISRSLQGNTTPGTATTTLCGQTALVSGATLGIFALCPNCWSLFIDGPSYDVGE